MIDSNAPKKKKRIIRHEEKRTKIRLSSSPMRIEENIELKKDGEYEDI
jgi:hypothetical protein